MPIKSLENEWDVESKLFNEMLKHSQYILLRCRKLEYSNYLPFWSAIILFVFI